MKAVRLLLVDDQALFREGIRTLLSAYPNLEVAGEAGNGEEAVESARALKPDVILMDMRMPVLDGVAAIRRIRAFLPECRIIALTTFDDDEYVFEGLRAGAVGYLLKDTPSEKLVEAIHAAARGESFLQPSIAAKVVAEFNRLSGSERRLEPNLTSILSERECEVLRYLAKGRSNKEIAADLGIAEGTVKNHLSHVFEKLGVLDRTQAALKARELGIV